MKKNGYILLACAAIGIPLAGYSYYRYAINHFTVGLQNANVNGINNGILSLRLTFFATNNTGVKFTILGNHFNVFANENLIGITSKEQYIEVPNNSKVQFYMDLDIDTNAVGNSLFSYLWDKLFSGNDKMQISLVGYCKVLINTLAVKINVDVNEKFDL